MTGTISIVDPRAERRQTVRSLPVLNDVKGKTVAILSNGWTSMDRLAAHFGQLLQKDYGVAKVLHVPIPISTPMDQVVLEQTRSEAHFAILGLAN